MRGVTNALPAGGGGLRIVAQGSRDSLPNTTQTIILPEPATIVVVYLRTGYGFAYSLTAIRNSMNCGTYIADTQIEFRFGLSLDGTSIRYWLSNDSPMVDGLDYIAFA